jgi:hypothetical protein
VLLQRAAYADAHISQRFVEMISESEVSINNSRAQLIRIVHQVTPGLFEKRQYLRRVGSHGTVPGGLLSGVRTVRTAGFPRTRVLSVALSTVTPAARTQLHNGRHKRQRVFPRAPIQCARQQFCQSIKNANGFARFSSRRLCAQGTCTRVHTSPNEQRRRAGVAVDGADEYINETPPRGHWPTDRPIAVGGESATCAHTHIAHAHLTSHRR